jgi:hypothetical protein
MTDKKTKYTKFEYQAAKQFLKSAEAEIVRQYNDPCVSDTVYRTANGNLWHESESKLESPEDDYSLVLKAVEE